jgi:phenylalanyl-tRNA synthetase alpha chain
MQKGRLSPINYALRDIAAIFGGMGFEIRGGPELETEWYNFTALNVPAGYVLDKRSTGQSFAHAHDISDAPFA